MCTSKEYLERTEILLKASEEDLKKELKHFIDIDFTIEKINEYENKLTKILQKEINKIKLGESNSLQQTVINVLQIMGASKINQEIAKLSKKILTNTVKKLADSYLNEIDRGLKVIKTTMLTNLEIDAWSNEMGNLIKDTNIKIVGRILGNALNKGNSVQDTIRELMENTNFTRERARRISITEMLGAHSKASNEAYLQSAVVTQYAWRHSGGKGINPRPAHIALDGTIIKKGDYFNVNGEFARYPRDTMLSAKERVYCHCVLQPIADENILGLSLKQRQQIQRDNIEEVDRQVTNMFRR